jgi:hypothetical protein
MIPNGQCNYDCYTISNHEGRLDKALRFKSSLKGRILYIYTHTRLHKQQVCNLMSHVSVTMTVIPSAAESCLDKALRFKIIT